MQHLHERIQRRYGRIEVYILRFYEDFSTDGVLYYIFFSMKISLDLGSSLEARRWFSKHINRRNQGCRRGVLSVSRNREGQVIYSTFAMNSCSSSGAELICASSLPPSFAL